MTTTLRSRTSRAAAFLLMGAAMLSLSACGGHSGPGGEYFAHVENQSVKVEIDGSDVTFFGFQCVDGSPQIITDENQIARGELDAARTQIIWTSQNGETPSGDDAAVDVTFTESGDTFTAEGMTFVRGSEKDALEATRICED